MKNVVCAALFSAALNTSAHAVVLHYDFATAGAGMLAGSGDDRQFESLVGGVVLRAQGYKDVVLRNLGDDVSASFDDTEAVTQDVTGGSRGLGVDSEGGDEGTRVDGQGPDEAILFELGLGGLLTEIRFANFSGIDDFDLIVDGVVTLVDQQAGAGDRWLGRVAYRRSFAIGANDNTDSFRVRSLQVEVPAPAAWSGLACATLLLALRRSRGSARALAT